MDRRTSRPPRPLIGPTICMIMDSRPTVEENVLKIGVVEPDEKVLVMLSGGSDSVCLAHLMAGRIKTAGVSAFHVNYGLRDQADEDERFCRKLCSQLGVGFFSGRASLPGKGNAQAEAREIRYRLAESIRIQKGLDLIVVGHTLTDQAETVIYRLATSPGRRALLGMRAREGRIARPLLGTTREEVRQYCQAEGLTWREDISNEDPTYARNRIRANVIPELQRINKAAEKNIVATRDALFDESKVLDGIVCGALHEVGAGGRPPSVHGDRLKELPVALQRLLVRELVQSATGGEFPLSAERADEVIELSTRQGSGGIDLGPVRAVSEYGVLRFLPVGELPELEATTLKVPGTCTLGEWEVTSELLAEVPVGLSGGHDQALLDADLLGSQVTVRPWNEGDRLRPLGMEGTKSLQDIFTDQKVPRSLRGRLPVLDVGGSVVWVAGVALSDEFKLTEKTQKAVRISARLID